jgi:hypothetical protein
LPALRQNLRVHQYWLSRANLDSRTKHDSNGKG